MTAHAQPSHFLAGHILDTPKFFFPSVVHGRATRGTRTLRCDCEVKMQVLTEVLADLLKLEHTHTHSSTDIYRDRHTDAGKQRKKKERQRDIEVARPTFHILRSL